MQPLIFFLKKNIAFLSQVAQLIPKDISVVRAAGLMSMTEKSLLLVLLEMIQPKYLKTSLLHGMMSKSVSWIPSYGHIY
jgi:hypothetical protein